MNPFYNTPAQQGTTHAVAEQHKTRGDIHPQGGVEAMERRTRLARAMAAPPTSPIAGGTGGRAKVPQSNPPTSAVAGSLDGRAGAERQADRLAADRWRQTVAAVKQQVRNRLDLTRRKDQAAERFRARKAIAHSQNYRLGVKPRRLRG